MKHKIIKPDKDFEFAKQDKKLNDKVTYNMFWFAQYNAFVPMLDLSLAFDEIKIFFKKMLKKNTVN